jgi:hypothetical protein
MVTGTMSSKSDKMVQQLLSPHTSPPQVPRQLVKHGRHRKVEESIPQPTLPQQLHPLPAGPVVIAAVAVVVTAAAAAVTGLEVEILDLLQPNLPPIDQTTPPPTLPLLPHHPLPTVVMILVPTPTRNLIDRTTLPPTELLEQPLPLMDPMSSDLSEVVVNRVVLAPTPIRAPARTMTQDPLRLHQVPTLLRLAPALILDRAPTRDPIPATLVTALHQVHGQVNRNPIGQTLHLPMFPTPSNLHLPSRNLERASVLPTPLLKLLKLLRPLHPLPNQHQHLKKDTLVPSLFLPISPVPVRLHPLL